MPFLMSFIASIATSIFDKVGSYLAKRGLIVAAIVTVFVAGTAAMYSALTSLANSVAPVLPAVVVTASTWVVPDNLGACVSAYLGARLARALYDANMRLLHMKASAS